MRRFLIPEMILTGDKWMNKKQGSIQITALFSFTSGQAIGKEIFQYPVNL